MCTFCPQDNLRTQYGTDAKYMSLATFQQALNNIAPDTRIDFSGMAEPWVNPECTDMLAYAFYFACPFKSINPYADYSDDEKEDILKKYK